VSSKGFILWIYTAQIVAGMAVEAIVRLLQSQAQTIVEQQRQLAWFRRQIFGSKSERLQSVADAQQLHLGQILGDLPIPPQARR